MNKEKLKNQVTINLTDDDLKLLNFICDANDRRAGEMVRILLKPILRNEFTKLMQNQHAENNEPLTIPIFKQ